MQAGDAAGGPPPGRAAVRRLPPLNALRVFEAAARFESFNRAAGRLHVTPSAVSHQIRTLEEFLGVALFRRSARAVRLTEAGRAFLPPVRDALEQIGTAAEHLMRRSESPALLLSVAPEFAIGWLVPRLTDFYAAHPEIEVRLDTSIELIDFRASDVDAAIRHTPDPRYEGLVAHPLVREELVPVCSPGMVERGLREPADLARFTLLHSRSRAGQWQNWLRLAGVPDLVGGGRQRFPSDAVALEAAASGLGVALANRVLVQRQLAEGRLVAPFEAGYRSDYGYYLVYPESSADDARIVAFRDWLLGVVAARGNAADVAATGA